MGLYVGHAAGLNFKEMTMFYNKVILAGNLTREPQLSYTPSETAVVDFGMAINKKYKDKETTCFVDCRAFGKTAENINKYLSKGNPLFVEGELTFDSWTAQDGSKRSKHRVTVYKFQFLDIGKKEPEDTGTEEEPF